MVSYTDAWSTDRRPSEGPCTEQLLHAHTSHWDMSWSRYLQALHSTGTRRDQQGRKESQGGTGLNTPWAKLGVRFLTGAGRGTPPFFCLFLSFLGG